MQYMQYIKTKKKEIRNKYSIYYIIYSIYSINILIFIQYLILLFHDFIISDVQNSVGYNGFFLYLRFIKL